MNEYDSYVSLKTAKMLKAVGFDWPCNYCYDVASEEFLDDNEGYLNFNDDPDDNTFISAPTLAVAQRWLREVKHRWVSVECENAAGLQEDGMSMFLAELFDTDDGYWYVSDWHKDIRKYRKAEYTTYEEALEAGIYECLILINK